jgi:hypothetical protein
MDALEVTGISTQEIAPESVSKDIAPIARFCMEVRPAEKSWVTAPELTLMPPANVEVAVVVVAVKYEATASPTTESFAYGEEVPIPTFPVEVKVSLGKEEVA